MEVEVRVTDFELSKLHGAIEFKQGLQNALAWAGGIGTVCAAGTGRKNVASGRS